MCVIHMFVYGCIHIIVCGCMCAILLNPSIPHPLNPPFLYTYILNPPSLWHTYLLNPPSLWHNYLLNPQCAEYACLGPYIPTWMDGAASWHPSVIGIHCLFYDICIDICYVYVCTTVCSIEEGGGVMASQSDRCVCICVCMCVFVYVCSMLHYLTPSFYTIPTKPTSRHPIQPPKNPPKPTKALLNPHNSTKHI
jgi:hypothetical protein